MSDIAAQASIRSMENVLSFDFLMSSHHVIVNTDFPKFILNDCDSLPMQLGLGFGSGLGLGLGLGLPMLLAEDSVQ